MNERINELIKQSYVTVQSPSGEGYTHFSQEKFAELIVKETMQVVANQLPSNQYLDVAHAVIEHYKDADVI
jgi:hypothetical protein